MNIEHLRKQAKALVKLYPGFSETHGQAMTLAGAQRVIAQLNGYPSWEAMQGAVDQASTKDDGHRIHATSRTSHRVSPIDIGGWGSDQVGALKETLRSIHPYPESSQEQLRLATMVSQKFEELGDDEFEIALRDDWTMFAVVLIPFISALEHVHLEFARTDRMRSIVETTRHEAPSRETNFATGLYLRKGKWQLNYAADHDRLIEKGLLKRTDTV